MLPAKAANSSTEIERLKNQVQALSNRIEELENKQSQSFNVNAGYDNGFYIKSKDGNFSLTANAAIQVRYSYVDFDKMVNSNNEDWNNFFLRRARLFFRGNAPDRDWTYYLQVQLEPQSSVNLHDAYIRWKKYPYAQVQFGRAKIPYGLEFWQSGFLLNGVERSIFSGETGIDGKSDDRKWPGGNADFRTSNEDSITKYALGGFNLFRSQGINLQGDIDLFNRKGFLQYWTGVYNGRNTKGSVSIDSNPLWAGRIAVNPFGKFKIVRQGDIDYSKDPKVSFLISGAQYTDRLTKYRSDADTDPNPDGYGDADSATYDIKGTAYDAAALFRYKGVSLDAEYAYERLKQERTSGYEWDRFGYRFNAGYFIIPEKLELISRYAYVERIKDNDRIKSLTSGLGLVSVNGGAYNAVEDNLREYSAGINYYLIGHRLKYSADYSYLVRHLIPVTGNSIEDQQDSRFRTMIQYLF
jgi:hypothetical protein